MNFQPLSAHNAIELASELDPNGQYQAIVNFNIAIKAANSLPVPILEGDDNMQLL